MEPFVERLMDELDIEEGIRAVIAKLWEHRYRTYGSCEGHGRHLPYVLFDGSDGWFEQNSFFYGFEKRINFAGCPGCNGIAQHPELSWRVCKKCGAGINDFSVYHGTNNKFHFP